MPDWLLLLGVSFGGALGAVLRYLVTCWVGRFNPAQDRAFPWATAAVNLTGSLVLGLLAGPLLTAPWGALISAGLLGGFTTFSAASLETVQLLRAGRPLAGAGYGLGMLAVCTALSLVGLLLTS